MARVTAVVNKSLNIAADPTEYVVGEVPVGDGAERMRGDGNARDWPSGRRTTMIYDDSENDI